MPGLHSFELGTPRQRTQSSHFCERWAQERTRLLYAPQCMQRQIEPDVASVLNRSVVLRGAMASLFVVGSSIFICTGNAYARTIPERKGTKESDRIHRAIDIWKGAQQAQADGEYSLACSLYSSLIEEYNDLALSERARIGLALMEYELGKVEDAILELEDLEIALRGNPEVHAALASIVYKERPQRVAFAELQWDIATEFDTRYFDINWVRSEKHWPPRMLAALESFLSLG